MRVRNGRFEHTHFKVMSPFQFATIGPAESVVSLKKRREFMDTYENVLYEEEIKGKRETKQIHHKMATGPSDANVREGGLSATSAASAEGRVQHIQRTPS